MEINRELAVKVLEVVDAGLVSGMGRPEPGQMCVEAAVNYAMGRPHGDEPECVSPVLRKLKIALNDKNWSSPSARAKGLRRLAIAQLGSRDTLDDKFFVRRLAESVIRKQVPLALRAAASIQKDSVKRADLMGAADRCEKEGTREAALNAKKAAYAAAAYAAAADAAAADAATAYADAADAADDAAYAAYADAADAAAAYAAAADAAAAAAAAAAADARSQKRDEVLAAFAEDVVQILVDMKVPGCEWLDLAPLENAA